jgi:hypothetical protein
MTLLSTLKSRRMAARIAVAGVVLAAPLTALAVPAFAATPDSGQTAIAIDWDNHDGGPGDHRDHGGDPRDDHGRPGPDQPMPPQPQPPMPPTGSFG